MQHKSGSDSPAGASFVKRLQTQRGGTPPRPHCKYPYIFIPKSFIPFKAVKPLPRPHCNYPSNPIPASFVPFEAVKPPSRPPYKYPNTPIPKSFVPFKIVKAPPYSHRNYPDFLSSIIYTFSSPPHLSYHSLLKPVYNTVIIPFITKSDAIKPGCYGSLSTIWLNIINMVITIFPLFIPYNCILSTAPCPMGKIPKRQRCHDLRQHCCLPKSCDNDRSGYKPHSGAV